MGGVGDELTLGLERRLQPSEQVVQRATEFGELVVRSVEARAGGPDSWPRSPGPPSSSPAAAAGTCPASHQAASRAIAIAASASRNGHGVNVGPRAALRHGGSCARVDRPSGCGRRRHWPSRTGRWRRGTAPPPSRRTRPSTAARAAPAARGAGRGADRSADSGSRITRFRSGSRPRGRCGSSAGRRAWRAAGGSSS